MKIVIQTADFDVSNELAELRAAHRDIGAIVSFVGTVRETFGQCRTMALEHYPGMTEKALEEIAREAFERWEIKDAVIIHRIGVLPVTAQIVLVAVASAHRGVAFSACEFMMDHLKTEAPFWKKEISQQESQWVAPRASDLNALMKWKNHE